MADETPIPSQPQHSSGWPWLAIVVILVALGAGYVATKRSATTTQPVEETEQTTSVPATDATPPGTVDDETIRVDAAFDSLNDTDLSADLLSDQTLGLQ